MEALLERMGWIEQGAASSVGRRVHKLAFVLHREADAERELAQAVRSLLPVQVIQQELAGYGPVPEEGVMELLTMHDAAPDGLSLQELRRFLRWANGVDLLTYSKRDKTVRVPTLESDEGLDSPAPAGVVSPRTPFTNLVRLRRILRRLKGVIWWADPYFDKRVLEELITNLDFTDISEIRIVSSNKNHVLSDEAESDMEAFVAEAQQKDVHAEWRYDPARNWHDRWLFADNEGYNMPPSGLIFSGKKYSEFGPDADRPPLEEWWDRSKKWY